MDFEDEEIFDEVPINSEEAIVNTEKEQLEALIQEATQRLEELNGGCENIEIETTEEEKEFDDQLMSTIIVKDATERLNSLGSKNVFTDVKDWAEISELADTIKSAASQYNNSIETVEQNEGEEVSNEYPGGYAVEYTDDEIMDTILIQDATERLKDFESQSVYTNPEDIAKISELANTITSAADRLSRSCKTFIPFEQDEEV